MIRWGTLLIFWFLLFVGIFWPPILLFRSWVSDPLALRAGTLLWIGVSGVVSAQLVQRAHIHTGGKGRWWIDAKEWVDSLDAERRANINRTPTAPLIERSAASDSSDDEN